MRENFRTGKCLAGLQKGGRLRGITHGLYADCLGGT